MHGGIAVEFLRGCGLLPWEVLEARLYNTDLTAREISQLQARILDKRAQGPFARVFISYSHVDAKFAEKLAARLGKAGFPVFIDRADLVAGPMQAQIANAIRCADVVVPVLSNASTTSDWVENEVEMARAKEKRENRCVLCPVALDDSWRAKLEYETSDRQLWRVLTKMCIVDFSKWKTKAFNREFEKLLRGIKIHYEPKHE